MLRLFHKPCASIWASCVAGISRPSKFIHGNSNYISRPLSQISEGNYLLRLRGHSTMTPYVLIDTLLQLSREKNVNVVQVRPALATLKSYMHLLDGSCIARAFQLSTALSLDRSTWIALCNRAHSFENYHVQAIESILKSLIKPIRVGRSLIVRQCVQVQPLVMHLCAQASSLTGKYKPSTASSILISSALLGIKDNVLAEKLLTTLDINSFAPKDIAKTLYYLSFCTPPDMALVKLLCNAALGRMSEFRFHALSVTFGALDRLSIEDGVLIQSMCNQALLHFDQGSPRDIGFMLLALANLKKYDEASVAKLCALVQTRIAFFDPPNIIFTFHALSKFGRRDDALTQEMLKVLSSVIQTSPHHIAVTLDALANFNLRDEVLIDCLRSIAKLNCSKFNSEGITLTLEALAKFGVGDDALIKGLCDAATNHSFDKKQTPRVLNALAKLCDRFAIKRATN